MMGGMRGVNAAGDRAANSDNIRDEAIVGSVYDHGVVMRLMTYIVPYKRDAFFAILAVLLYTAANVCIPYLVEVGIDGAIEEGDLTLLHWVGAAFLLVAVLHFIGNYLQFVFMPRSGSGDPVLTAHQDVQSPAGTVAVVLPPHAGWPDHVTEPERCSSTSGNLRADRSEFL